MVTLLRRCSSAAGLSPTAHRAGAAQAGLGARLLLLEQVVLRLQLGQVLRQALAAALGQGLDVGPAPQPG